MGDLATALAALPSRRTSVPCLTCTLPAEVRKLIEDDRASAAPHSFDQLSRFLATRGIAVGGNALGAHFRKGHAR